jgi:hypothetical protein
VFDIGLRVAGKNMKLGKREKYMVAGAGAVLGLFILLRLILFPFFEKRSQLERGITAKQEALKEIIELQREYKHLKEGAQDILSALEKREKSFSLFAHLEKMASETGIKEHIKYMKPSSSAGNGPYVESAVEMQLVGISLEQLTQYLYLVENPEKIIWIKRASIKAQKQPPRYLDVVLQVLTIIKKDNS